MFPLPTDDRTLSPYTGWTRAHWEAVADGLLAAVQPYRSADSALITLPGRESWSRCDGLEGYARTFLLAAFRVAGGGPAALLAPYEEGLEAGPEVWPRIGDRTQPMVEAASIALSLWLTRDRLWDRLPARTRERVAGYLSDALRHEPVDNNWWLFPAVVGGFLTAAGLDAQPPGPVPDGRVPDGPMPDGRVPDGAATTNGPEVAAAEAAVTRDPAIAAAEATVTRGPAMAAAEAAVTRDPAMAAAGAAVTRGPDVGAAEAAVRRGLDRIEGWYVGDGWYSDGDNRSFDHYNGWAMHLYPALLGHLSGTVDPRHRERLRTFLAGYSLAFDSGGGMLYHGRSVTYRFASAASLFAGALIDATPLTPGQTRRVASGLLRHFLEHRALSPEGLLTLGWYGPHEPSLQDYSGSASPYWASKAFLGLLLPPDHPVWTAVEEPGPEGTVALPGPGLILGNGGGVARLLNHGSRHHAGDPLYDRYAYSSRTGPTVNVPDNHVGLVLDDGTVTPRGPLTPRGAGTSGGTAWAASAGDGMESLSVLRGQVELRVHRVPRGAAVRQTGWALTHTTASTTQAPLTVTLRATNAPADEPDAVLADGPVDRHGTLLDDAPVDRHGTLLDDAPLDGPGDGLDRAPGHGLGPAPRDRLNPALGDGLNGGQTGERPGGRCDGALDGGSGGRTDGGLPGGRGGRTGGGLVSFLAAVHGYSRAFVAEEAEGTAFGRPALVPVLEGIAEDGWVACVAVLTGEEDASHGPAPLPAVEAAGETFTITWPDGLTQTFTLPAPPA
ncbi:DUF2264 domain-containing protein [Nonomuraea pusilla]|uniref:DUF2264 domain-containing protein n=1 Tax=Nonomuraea pusilla TaxID=46177 RepID=A0A1H8H3L5_9ACTN|nr:DUF2264 domain-containing protein [Nonomuraea pusilla]SEN50609.1 hypothetical protein SAMN05660976_07707 [Nonomuraea pusilla]